MILFLFFYVLHRSVGKVFCTMDGNGSMVHIHPSSSVNVFLNSFKKSYPVKNSFHRGHAKTLMHLLWYLLWSWFLVAPSCLTRMLSWIGSFSMMYWRPHGCISGQCVLFDMSGWRTCYRNSMRWMCMNWAAWQERKWLVRRCQNGRTGKQPKDKQVFWINY